MLTVAGNRLPDELEVRTFVSSRELEVAQPSTFDALFLEIGLAGDDGTNGIELVSRLVPLGSHTQVVFVSRYDEYHTAVYRAPHAAFLKKPFRAADVETALDLALAASLRESPRPIVFRTRGARRIVNPANIAFLESDLRIVRVHLLRGETFEFYGKLTSLLEELPPFFKRCHQSFVINLSCVGELGTSEARLTDGASVPVSRRYRTDVREALFQYIRSRAV